MVDRDGFPVLPTHRLQLQGYPSAPLGGACQTEEGAGQHTSSPADQEVCLLIWWLQLDLTVLALLPTVTAELAMEDARLMKVFQFFLMEIESLVPTS